jgi:radical SAM superfamily enzyme YgiQ (UPF0313 family)
MEKQEIIDWLFSRGWTLTAKAVETDDYLVMKIFIKNATSDNVEKEFANTLQNYIRKQKLKQYD